MDIATLGFRIDSSQAIQAAKDLDRLTEAAERAGRATDRVRTTGAAAPPSPPVEGSLGRAAGGQAGEVGGSLGRASARGGASKAAEAVKSIQGAIEFGKALKESEDPLMTFIEQGLKVAEVAIGAGGSLSAWTSALGLSNPYVLGAAVAVGALVGAFALFHREATKDYSDLPKQLGLTAKEVENLKAKGIETSITMGDTFKATFEVLSEDAKKWSDEMLASMGTSWTEVGKVASQVLDGLNKGLAYVLAFFRAGWESHIKGFGYLFRHLPAILGDAFITAFNAAGKIVETFVNAQINKINGLAEASNRIFGTKFGKIDHVDFKEMHNPYKDAGAGLARAFTEPLSNVAKYVEDYFKLAGRVGARAAGDAIKDIKDGLAKGDAGLAAGCACKASDAGAARDAANDNAEGGAFRTRPVDEDISLDSPLEAVKPKDVALVQKGVQDLPKLISPVRAELLAIGQDLSRSFSQAIANGQDLGDALSNTFKRIAASYLENGINDLLGSLLKTGGGGSAGAAGAAAGGGDFLSTMFKSIGGFFGFDGGGYTGDGSRSGGVDGKGGFLAVMHPRETVIDHTKGGGGVGGGGQAVNVAVSVSVDDDGRIQAYVRDSSVRAVQAGISQYDAGMPQRVAAIGNDPRRR